MKHPLRTIAVVSTVVISLAGSACQKKSAESSYGSTDTIQTGSTTPGAAGSAVTNSSGGAEAIPITETSATSTSGTSATTPAPDGSTATTGTSTTTGTAPAKKTTT